MSLKLYRRPGGVIWHYRGTVAKRRLRGSTGTESKERAAQIIARLEDQSHKHSLFGPEAVLTFAQAALRYRAAGKSTRYLDKIEDFWKDTLVRDINPGLIRQSARTLYPGTSGATMNRHVIVPTQAIINFSAESELCPKIQVPRFPVERRVKKPIDMKWVEALASSSPPHLACLALFMLLTGARIGEALSLQWGDVNLTRRVALIRQTKVGKEREAHLPPSLIVALANIERIPGRTVFRYVDKASAWKAWRTAIARAGIEVLSFHCCRHGFATGLLQRGVDPVTVAKLGGWATPQHVFQTYGHARDDKTLTNLLEEHLSDTRDNHKAKKITRSIA